MFLVLLRKGKLRVVVVGDWSLYFIGIAEEVSIFIHRYVKYIMVNYFKMERSSSLMG